jgi:hypothetical protein
MIGSDRVVEKELDIWYIFILRWQLHHLPSLLHFARHALLSWSILLLYVILVWSEPV